MKLTPSQASAEGSSGTGERQASPWSALFVLCLGTVVILIDTTIVNVAVPSFTAGLHASLGDALWVLNAYLLVYAATLVTFGRMGDYVGPRRMFAVGLGLFTLASVLCGVAQTPGQLIGFRVLQGV